ncbi:hypothetical protein AKJ09_09586 [Labilithrix luteola]|uniref:Uncharacterized protein n=1 Tax=Labilithrix luteola TaxID=1391654 RepID=A0A0K1QB14_9BACT|nr:hypothetical protein [Labilithrix luteola]AKV02923.1 hypothetical protein AKJ09_09586 [Labilithrix luteola]
MPEANALIGVTAAVVVGLVIWVAIVLRTAKEPWARPLATSPGVPGADTLEVNAEPVVAESSESDAKGGDDSST